MEQIELKEVAMHNEGVRRRLGRRASPATQFPFVAVAKQVRCLCSESEELSCGFVEKEEVRESVRLRSCNSESQGKACVLSVEELKVWQATIMLQQLSLQGS